MCGETLSAGFGVPHDLPRGDGLRKRLGEWKRAAVARATVPLSTCFGSLREGVFGILMYHRITPVIPGVAEPTWNVPPERFRSQLVGLLKRGFEPWPLREVLDHARRGIPVPRSAFVVTFDDGYENVYTEAWPILRELSVPATIFLATAYLDSPSPFPSDDWSAAGSSAVPAISWKPLSTAHCLEMQQEGLIELGCHTHTHADFRNRPEALKEDLLHSRRILKSRFGISEPTFAFPYGTKRLGFSGPLLSAAAKEAGMQCSLTTEAELVPADSDPFDWGRLTAEASDSGATLAAKLNGWYGLAQKAWGKVRRPFSSPHAPDGSAMPLGDESRVPQLNAARGS